MFLFQNFRMATNLSGELFCVSIVMNKIVKRFICIVISLVHTFQDTLYLCFFYTKDNFVF